jgi:hypothetical protein
MMMIIVIAIIILGWATGRLGGRFVFGCGWPRHGAQIIIVRGRHNDRRRRYADARRDLDCCGDQYHQNHQAGQKVSHIFLLQALTH